MDEADVVVVGSGAAGLCAALAAAAGGARVVLLEAAARWGGATGVSGGQVWVPGHHHGPPEDPDDVLAYLIAHTEGREDRKSTRLNSSHMSISYAVFCLKKKKQNKSRQEFEDTRRQAC